ncbi:MAG: hypothetical protein ACAI38_09625 [Myxococcota bacterium]|nr:hypothetical protein [Myxococcota bacterium]
MSSGLAVAPTAQGGRVEPVASRTEPVPFSEVQSALNGIIGRWTASRGREPDLSDVHYGDIRWGTPNELLNSNAFGYPFIAPELRGNGRADETNLVRVLSGTHPDMPRMPLGGPYATDQELATIRNWINGLPTTPQKAAAAPDFGGARVASWLRPAATVGAMPPAPGSHRRLV